MASRRGQAGRVVELEGVGEPITPDQVRQQLADGGRVVEIEGVPDGADADLDVAPATFRIETEASGSIVAAEGQFGITRTLSFGLEAGTKKQLTIAGIPGVTVGVTGKTPPWFAPWVLEGGTRDCERFGFETQCTPYGFPIWPSDDDGNPIPVEWDDTPVAKPFGWEFEVEHTEEGLRRLFREDIWDEETENLRRLLRERGKMDVPSGAFITPRSSESERDEERALVREYVLWWQEVCLAIGRMRASVNSTRWQAIDDPFDPAAGRASYRDRGQITPFRPFIWWEGGFPRGGSPHGHAISTPGETFNPQQQRDVFTFHPQDIPVVGGEATLRRFALDEDRLRNFQASFDPNEVALAFVFNPGFMLAVTREYERWAGRYLALRYKDALQAAWTDWLANNATGKLQALDARNLAESMNRPVFSRVRDTRAGEFYRSVARMSREVDRTDAQVRVSGAMELAASKFDTFVRVDVLEADLKGRLRASQRDRPERVRDVLDAADGVFSLLDSASGGLPESATEAKEEIEGAIESVLQIRENASKLRGGNLAAGAEIVGDLEKLVGQVEGIANQFTEDEFDAASDVIDEIRRVGSEIKAAVPSEVTNVANGVINAISKDQGIEQLFVDLATLLVTTIGTAIAGPALGAILGFLVNTVLNAIGLVPDRPPPPEISFDNVIESPCYMWGFSVFNTNALRETARTGIFYQDTFQTMANLEQVFDVELGIADEAASLPIRRDREDGEGDDGDGPADGGKRKGAGTVAVVGGLGILGLLGWLLLRGGQQQQTSGTPQEDEMQPLRVENFSLQQAQARLQQLGAQYQQGRSTGKLQVYWAPGLRQWIGVRRRGKQLEIGYFNECPCGG